MQNTSVKSPIFFFLLRTQNPRRFPGFAVVVVTFFGELFDDFNVFSECLFPEEINNPFWGLTRFSMKSDNFYWR